MKFRACTRTGCSLPAVATLTYVYAESTAVVGPLALRAEPGCYDLCADHSLTLSAPRGWEVIRLPGCEEAAEPSRDDLLALAEAVRAVAFSYDEPSHSPAQAAAANHVVELGRKRHLTVLADPDA